MGVAVQLPHRRHNQFKDTLNRTTIKNLAQMGCKHEKIDINRVGIGCFYLG
jgi:hypothetical protein